MPRKKNPYRHRYHNEKTGYKEADEKIEELEHEDDVRAILKPELDKRDEAAQKDDMETFKKQQKKIARMRALLERKQFTK